MNKMQKVLENVLGDISLSKEQERGIQETTKKFLKLLGGGFRVGGSLAKGTLVKKKKQDVDLFFVFENEKDIGKLEGLLKKKKVNYRILHGSRDYFSISFENVEFEIVPVKRFSKPEKAENVTDFSLLHVDYIKKQIKKDKKIVNEIKLAKAFCHAQDYYGAESYIGGFSGYSLEVLVCYYKSFIKMLKGLQKDKIIDPAKYFKNRNLVMQELNASKLQSPIVVVDPTYQYRNVCAGLKQETFDKFIKSAKKFLKKPTEKMFEKIKIDVEGLRRVGAKKENLFLKIKLATNKQEGDIAGTKMKKFFDFLCSELERKQQKVLAKEFVYSDGKTAEGFIVIKENKIVDVRGPEKNMKNAIKSFKKVRKKTFTKGRHVWARERVSIDEILKRTKKVGAEMGVGF